VGKLRAFLELVRLPNLFTAAADVLAGYLTVSYVGDVIYFADFIDVQRMLWLVIASVCLYAAGVVLNDYFDEPLDRVERPERPLPSGRVSRAAARRLAVGLIVFGALAAASVGPVSLGLALTIAFCAAFYDAIGKRTAFGPLNMGLCRFLNLLLGVSAVPPLLVGRLTLALLLMVHVTGVTVVSRGEVWGGTRATPLVMVGALGTIALSLVMMDFGHLLPDRSYAPFLLLFLGVVGLPLARAYSDPSPRNLGLSVKWGVLGLVLLDATFAAAFAGPLAGLAVAALIIPSILVARLFAVT
jgi:4-hydroxybenzoate polyprenyltransferase